MRNNSQGRRSVSFDLDHGNAQGISVKRSRSKHDGNNNRSSCSRQREQQQDDGDSSDSSIVELPPRFDSHGDPLPQRIRYLGEHDNTLQDIVLGDGRIFDRIREIVL